MAMDMGSYKDLLEKQLIELTDSKYHVSILTAIGLELYTVIKQLDEVTKLLQGLERSTT